MIITYYGISCFKAQSGETVIAFDPPSKKAVPKTPRFETHAVFISHDHDRHNGRDSLNAKKEGGDLFIIDGPGEYETEGVYAVGAQSFHDDSNGKKHGLNTVYVVEMEGIRICHLGDIGEKKIREELAEQIGGVDVLFIPIGGDTVIDAETAAGIANDISPGIVIPMHYDDNKQGKQQLETFLKELGQEGVKPEEKLTIKKKDVVEGETRVVVLKSAI